MSATRRNAGFTLVELVVVLVVAGVLVGIAVPLLRPEKFVMDGAVLQVASTLSAQQRNAVLRQHDIVLALDTANQRFRVHYDADKDKRLDSGEETFVVEFAEGVVVGRGGAPARPMSSSNYSMTETEEGLPSLTYHRNGSASQESIIYLTSRRAGASGFAEDARAVEIARATGRIACYSYASGAWVKTC